MHSAAIPDQAATSVERIDVLGMDVSALNMVLAIQWFQRAIAHRARAYVCVATVHTVMQTRRSAAFRRAVNTADLVTGDGMPLVWLLRAAGHSDVTRVYGPELMLAAMRSLVPAGTRHFLYGGTGGVTDILSERLRQRIPGLVIAGAITPPFAGVSELASDDVARQINDAAPDVVWVGLGTPKQELWMAAMRGRIQAPILVGVGAAFDFHSGSVRQAPSWMQGAGLEWLFRLSQDPKRLWRRYLLDNSMFVLTLALDRLRFSPTR